MSIYEPPKIETTNSSASLANTDMESLDDVVSRTGTSQDENTLKTIRQPSIVIRDKKVWPRTIELLKNLGVIPERSYNVRDGMKMLLPTIKIYVWTVDILEQHTYIQQNRDGERSS
ncbi:hypothetical protein JTB14_028029 [Gonioctena quinquepunctata]|nr:hypothetical protein JTB14_028029 [Gonioctena quinquepunctata]